MAQEFGARAPFGAETEASRLRREMRKHRTALARADLHSEGRTGAAARSEDFMCVFSGTTPIEEARRNGHDDVAEARRSPFGGGEGRAAAATAPGEGARRAGGHRQSRHRGERSVESGARGRSRIVGA